MRSSAFYGLAVLFGGFLAVAPLPAHHSFSAEYDAKKSVEMKGIVTKVEWMNPQHHEGRRRSDCRRHARQGWRQTGQCAIGHHGVHRQKARCRVQPKPAAIIDL
jgi:hypothetical protein